MAGRQTPKKRRGWIAAAVLAGILLFACAVGCIVLFYQSEAAVNDSTALLGAPGGSAENGNAGDGGTSGGGDAGDGGEDAQAVLSANVTMFSGEDAAAVNGAITQVEVTNQGLYVDMAEGTVFDELGPGDCFYLEGSQETPLGETYIGKVTSLRETDDGVQYQIEAPMVDEVFDVLTFDYAQILTEDNVSQVETLEGVTVTNVDSLESYFDASAEAAVAAPMAETSMDGLLFEFDIDLLKAFGIKKDEADLFPKYDETEGGRVKVFRTETGICYHREECPCAARSAFEMTLAEAVAEGFEPCHMCNPPVLEQNGVSNLDTSVQLTGKIGLESIDFGLDYNWDILNGGGLEDFSIFADGNFLAQAEVKANLEYELSGQTTTISLPFNTVKLQGLKEKMFPIAFVGYNGSITPVVSGNDSIRSLTGAVPMTIGIVLYVDIEGNVTVGARAYFSYSQSFSYRNELVKGGEWLCDQSVQTEPSVDAGFELEAAIDADAHLGASVSLYVFNLNVAELAIGRVGAQAEGSIKLDYSLQGAETGENGIEGSYYMRLYYQLLELNVKLKTKVQFWKIVNASAGVDYTYLYLDKTIAEWGSKSPTKYSSGSMSYSAVTAQDAEAVYYKDTDGKLIREQDGGRTGISDRDFYVFCGIDESYLYVLVPGDGTTYEIYRIAKDGSTERKIAEDVKTCLTMDETYLYYTTGFDPATITRLNREYLKEDTFASFGETVAFMGEQGDDYYVVTQQDDILAIFFGGSFNCWLVDRNGDTIAEYGDEPEVGQYYRTDEGAYQQAARMTSSGYLRGTASEIYWMSKDGQTTVEAEGISGWNGEEAGIFTTVSSDGGEAPYRIVLYRAADGAQIPVTEVYSDQAFFTLCQSSAGDWYFFDQTDTELILYVMPEDFSSKSVVKTFSLEELPCSLSDSGMTIVDNRIYFYTMPDDRTSKVLYRYDLVIR